MITAEPASHFAVVRTGTMVASHFCIDMQDVVADNVSNAIEEAAA